ncbi:MAG: hypothetical protein OEV45_03740 [Desulfobacteraceae bacterium]|nr:hypothetical protein [Desulfobacteraceae bacterium]
MKSKTFVLSLLLMAFACIISGCMDRMPYNFNSKVSRYPNSKIVNIMRLNGGCYAELETIDSGKKVLEYYKNHMARTGWYIRIERGFEPWRVNDPETTAFLALFKGSEGLLIDTYTPVNGGKTQIALFLGDTDV